MRRRAQLPDPDVTGRVTAPWSECRGGGDGGSADGDEAEGSHGAERR